LPDNRAKGASAFTLVELSAVMLVIAILIGFIFTAGNGMIDRARKTQAKNDLTQIVTAVNAYYTEYGKYPMADIKQGSDTLYGDPGGSNGNEDVFNVLRAANAGVNLNNSLNPRQIIYFTASNPKVPTAPLEAIATQDVTTPNGGTAKAGAFVDPWGNSYMIAIDGNYDGLTTDFIPYTSGVTYGAGNTVPGGCFSLSYGKDGKQGKKQSNGTGDKNYAGSDDILSWQ
jgi:type II secretory pathway pseudopilin PulG